MNINRDNYEEFFILYGDNELSSEDRLSVESFVVENPDLQAEFSLLNQIRFNADDNISFENKDSLLKVEDLSGSKLNESLLLYIDNELDAETVIELEKKLSNDPLMQAELNQFRNATFDPRERIVFPYKESLYRKEEKTRVIPLAWRRMAAAAALLVAVSVTALVLVNRKQETPAGLAATPPVEINKYKEEVAVSIPEDIEVSNDTAVNRITVPVTRESLAGNNPVNNSGNKEATGIKKERILRQSTVKETPAQDLVKKDNNLPKPLYNPNVVNSNSDQKQIAVNDVAPKETTTLPKEKNTLQRVTPANDEALHLTANTSADYEAADAGQSSKKSKLRGFLRKVTRTFEKTTNIKATDEEDRLLLGGLAIKL